ncbi:hypothetical protein BCR33DRAFT_769727 [Rhizoclosmatium globosum]|uniref:Ceramide glucosyltransferase n=1 Tax=Rhizoclosmatium globosum TaxID=329046 RepID=A0A1Y2BSM3_9FUNG|nr:hypothetical protein BCR33DRAFT_769727 [Rhizoclosmatium globosum]|eukprot:ORY37637.1 hypothetical protein BCR33DRAFT_769727 [Rhizoclosmatium globosum]
MKEFPDVDMKLIVGETNVGVNPKVNNLVTSYSLAKHEIIWILDSNIIVRPQTLGRAVDCLLAPNVGLVHHIPVGIRPESFATTVEQVYLNTSHAKMYTMINKVRAGSCVIGKSNMFRKSEIAHLGGLAFFGKYMGEDNMMGRAIWDEGRLHVIPADVVYQPLCGKASLKDYFQRRARWIRMRKYMDIVAVILEPFSDCIVNGIVASYAFNYAFGVSRGWYFVAHVFSWFMIDVTLSSILEPTSVKDIGCAFWQLGFYGRLLLCHCICMRVLEALLSGEVHPSDYVLMELLFQLIAMLL